MKTLQRLKCCVMKCLNVYKDVSLMIDDKKVKDLLMASITDFAIAENVGDHFASGYHMGNIHAYLTALGENARPRSPWHRLWRQVFTCTL